MSTTLIPLEVPPDLLAMNVDGLRAELARQMAITASDMLRLAMIVRLLEERGEDLSDLRNGMLPHLRRIAYGQILPELVVRYSSTPMVLHRIYQLSPPEQQQLVRTGMVELVVRRATPEGQVSFDKRCADPSRMTRDQVFQVFGLGHVRNEAEQILYLEDRTTRVIPLPPPQGRCKPDRSRGGLVVGRTFLPHAEVLRGLADLRGEPSPLESGAEAEAEDVPLVVKLTPDERRRLKIASARGDTTMQELAWQALRAAGLI